MAPDQPRDLKYSVEEVRMRYVHPRNRIDSLGGITNGLLVRSAKRLRMLKHVRREVKPPMALLSRTAGTSQDMNMAVPILPPGGLVLPPPTSLTKPAITW